MSTCKVCSRKYRKGCIAFIIVGNAVKGARVCQPCAKDGVLLVAARPAVTKVVEKGGSVAPEVLKNLKAQVRALKATLAQIDTTYVDPDGDSGFLTGKIEGMENAIAALGGRS